MVDSVDNSFNSLQRIQQIALSNLKQRLLPGDAPAQKTAVVPVKFNAVQQGDKTAFVLPKANTPLPRGSIVDRLV